MSIAVSGTKVTIDRGDDGTLRWSVTDQADAVTDISSASFIFTVRHRIIDNTPAVTLDSTAGVQISSATGGVVDVNIPNSVTRNMSAGNYYYDFQMTLYDKIYTVGKGKFSVTEDVTR
jgi:hypothetical protein